MTGSGFCFSRAVNRLLFCSHRNEPGILNSLSFFSTNDQDVVNLPDKAVVSTCENVTKDVFQCQNMCAMWTRTRIPSQICLTMHYIPVWLGVSCEQSCGYLCGVSQKCRIPCKAKRMHKWKRLQQAACEMHRHHGSVLENQNSATKKHATCTAHYLMITPLDNWYRETNWSNNRITSCPSEKTSGYTLGVKSFLWSSVICTAAKKDLSE